MAGFDNLLKEALRRVNENVRSPGLEDVGPDTNVFDQVDSMTVVDLLLETESMLEEETGDYVPLADDTIFDASASPLRRWSDWVAHVERHHDR